MTFTIDLIDSGALNLLRDMERLSLIHVNALPRKMCRQIDAIRYGADNTVRFVRTGAHSNVF